MESKYKLGDKVRVKSLYWYNSNKNEDGEITMNDLIFTKEMSKYCGEEFEICSISDDGYMLLKCTDWCWSDWMFEDKPTFNKMKKVFIRGNEERGSEIIEMLENLGGVNSSHLKGIFESLLYYINKDNKIDSVSLENELGTIIQECFEELHLPKPIKKKLPNTWEEWVEQNKRECFVYINNSSDIKTATSIVNKVIDPIFDKNLIRGKSRAESFLALMQLINLRDEYRQGWVPDWKNNSKTKYCIEYHEEILCTGAHTNVTRFLSFQSEKIRDKFYDNFKNLIEQAKEFI